MAAHQLPTAANCGIYTTEATLFIYTIRTYGRRAVFKFVFQHTAYSECTDEYLSVFFIHICVLKIMVHNNRIEIYSIIYIETTVGKQHKLVVCIASNIIQLIAMINRMCLHRWTFARIPCLRLLFRTNRQPHIWIVFVYACAYVCVGNHGWSST